MLIGKAEIGFVPALLKLVALVCRGEAFKHNVETEYYLLKRACFLGHDCATLERHLQRLAQQIAPGRAAHSARQARRRIPHIETILKGAKL